MEGRKFGRKEADLLAIRVGENGNVTERLHIEVSLSTSPLGPIKLTPQQAAERRVKRKFGHTKLNNHIRKILGGEFKQVYVHGVQKTPHLRDLCKTKGIACVRVGKL